MAQPATPSAVAVCASLQCVVIDGMPDARRPRSVRSTAVFVGLVAAASLFLLLVADIAGSTVFADTHDGAAAVSTFAGALAVFAGALGIVVRATRRRRAPPAGLPVRPAGSLGERVTRAQASLEQAEISIREALGSTTASLREVLGSTTGIVDALQDELRARRAALDALAAEAQDAETRADRARALARIEESSARAVDALLDQRLRELLSAQEKAARRWDMKIMGWTLALGVPFGILTGVLGTRLFGH